MCTHNGASVIACIEDDDRVLYVPAEGITSYQARGTRERQRPASCVRVCVHVYQARGTRERQRPASCVRVCVHVYQARGTRGRQRPASCVRVCVHIHACIHTYTVIKPEAPVNVNGLHHLHVCVCVCTHTYT
jgi:hypothetical protein